MKLFDFAYCGFYRNQMKSLAALSPEKWSFEGKDDNYILVNYIEFTFQRVFEEKKIVYVGQSCLFNTGLFDDFMQPIYAYFEKNLLPGKQAWHLESFLSDYSLTSLGITELPDRANYFEDVSDLVFDTKLDLVLQYDHIFGDEENVARLPENLKKDKQMARRSFDGAIAYAKKKLAADYKFAVPQFYKGHMQLLIPIYLTNNVKPDLVLACSKTPDKKKYCGATCLTLEMAYNNARLIAKPESNWLKP